MNKKQVLTFVGLALTSLLLLIGWNAIAPSIITAQGNQQLLVSAAISLKDVLEDIKGVYQTSRPGIQVTYNFGASGLLQQQIEQGAPADIFISAGKKQMDALQQKGFVIPNTVANLAQNQLVLILPKDSTLSLKRFQDLVSPQVRRIAIGEPRSVPAGQYADQVFQRLGIAATLKPKLIFSNNVRQVLTVVESGNVDAGVVYLTDAKTSNRVKLAAIAKATDHAPIVYPMAVVKNTKHEAAAREFLKFVSSPPAQKILRKYGFSTSRSL